MNVLKSLAAGVTLALALTAPLTATAQDYPERAVEFIVPWSPGGGSDTLMRIVANNIKPFLGAEMPVINMPGAGGTVGLREASRRNADGYTISQVHEGLLTASATGLTKLKWTDFEPVALMTASPQFLVIGKDLPYKNFKEFVAYAKANPGKITMGVTLAGVPHLHAAMIEEAFGLKFSYVGYEGTGQRIRALVGGNLDAAIGDISSAAKFDENGDLIFLAVGSKKRMTQAPDVPTFKELGADLELAVTRGIVAPKGTPAAAKDALEAAFGKMSTDPTFVKQINNAGAAVDFRGQKGYAAYLNSLSSTVDRLAAVLAP